MMIPTRRVSEFEKGVDAEAVSTIFLLIGPLLIIFGIYLLICLAPENDTLKKCADWKLTRGTLTSFEGALYSRGQFEVDTIFAKKATGTYSYNVGDDNYTGGVVLYPQGWRTYNGAQDFADSGDSDRQNQITARYEKTYKYPPIGGWTVKKTPMQAASYFRFAALAPNHYLAIRYNPDKPSESVLSELTKEHVDRISTIAYASMILGVLLMCVRFVLSYFSSQVGSDDRDIASLYDKLNPDTAHLR